MGNPIIRLDRPKRHAYERRAGAGHNLVAVRSPPHPRRHCERLSRAATQRGGGVGFTLAEIAELIALDSTNDRARTAQTAGDRLAALDQKSAVLEGARTALGRLRKTCTSGTKGPCPILEAFEE